MKNEHVRLDWLIDETEQEDKAMMDELDDLSLSHDWDY